MLSLVAVLAMRPRRALARHDRAAGLGQPRRGRPLHRAHAHAARRDQPRPLRRAARRLDRARPRVRALDLAHRPDRSRRAADSAVGGRTRGRGHARAQAAPHAGRPDAARRRRNVRRRDDRLRPVEVAAALARRARPHRLRRHDQRQHPADDGDDADTAAAPGTRERGRVGVHQRVERARRLRVRRGRIPRSAPFPRSSPAGSR